MGTTWRDWLSLDGGRARREQEVRALAYCSRCGDIKLNTFHTRANFAITDGTDWYCPKCDLFFEYHADSQSFVETTDVWLEIYLACIYCGQCGHGLDVESVDPPVFRCRSCNTRTPANLQEIRLRSLDPFA